MSTTMIMVTSISLAGLLAIAIYHFIQSKSIRRFIWHVIIIGIAFASLYFFFFKQQTPAPKSDTGNDIYFVIVLYFFMLLGMVAHYAHARFVQPKRLRKKFDFGLFIAPVFASPIIFIPLLSALQTANVDLRQLTTAKIMIFLVAFENGFFWKEYFDNRRQLKAEGKDEK